MMIYNTDAMEQMKNPLSPVKMVRESYSRWLQRNITEVQVQFKDEEPAWIPYTCLLYTSPSPRDGLLSRMPSSA